MRAVQLAGQICLRLFIASCVFLLFFFVLMFGSVLVSAGGPGKNGEGPRAVLPFFFSCATCLVATFIGALSWWRDRTWFGAVKHSIYCALFAAILGALTGLILAQLMDLRQSISNDWKLLVTVIVASLCGGILSAGLLTYLRALFIRLNNAPPPPSVLFGTPPASRVSIESPGDPTPS